MRQANTLGPFSFSALFALSAPLLALPHGGMYRGPGEVNPGGSGSSRSGGGSTPAPAPQSGGGAPAGSSSAGGSTGSTAATTPTSTATSGAGKGAARGVMVGEDFSKWQFWWEYNKDSYLLLKESLRATLLVAGSDEQYMGPTRMRPGHLAAPPSAVDVEKRIVPALRQALESTDNRDIVSSCLVGLAKVGRGDDALALLPIFKGYLKSHDQEIRETAALALGIAHRAEAAGALMHLATDSPAGRELVGRSRVDARTRSFAMYGLGLVAHANPDPRTRLPILHAVRRILADETIVDRNVKVAALNALGLFHCADEASSATRRISEDAVRVLVGFYDDDSSRGRDVVRAHVPTAVARLLGDADTELARGVERRLVASLRADAKESGLIQRSAALALGQMALPVERHKADGAISRVLRRYSLTGRDGQARYFSLIALAQIGGGANRQFLLRTLHTGSRSLERPWAALALGCYGYRERRATGAIDHLVGNALHNEFAEARTPYAKGALAIALGLVGHRDAAPEMLDHLGTHSHQDEMSGYLCVGLALMQYEKSVPAIIGVLDSSVRRPHRMRMAAVALGKLGDRRLSKRLLAMLEDREPSLAKMAAVSSALSQIGDRASIDPLREMLANRDLPNLTRAFAAVALGGIGDKEPLPWNAKIAVNMNYRAAVETLVQSGAGVLEIL